MQAAGVIVEYNPFHNGHLYHLQQTQKQTKADVVIAVMSGNFLQRGEPALLSKWTRSELALRAGADLVFELPYAFSTQNAEVFAGGAVSILKALKTNVLCFGSEAGSVRPFESTLTALKQNETRYRRSLKTFLSEGYNYPKAHALAFRSMGFPEEKSINLSQPNNILGFSYFKAAVEQECSFSIETIERREAGYHDLNPGDSTIASATSIRRTIFNQGDITSINPYVPEYTYDVLATESQNNGLINWNDFFPYLKYRLLSATPEELRDIYEAEEGLEHRLLKHINNATDFQNFMEQIKTKRYTWTRLQRLCLHIVMNAKKPLMKTAHDKKQSPYLRLLGMTAVGRTYLNQIKDDLTLPLVTTIERKRHPLQDLDWRAAQLYNHVLGSKRTSAALKAEHKQTPIILR